MVSAFLTVGDRAAPGLAGTVFVIAGAAPGLAGALFVIAGAKPGDERGAPGDNRAAFPKERDL